MIKRKPYSWELCVERYMVVPHNRILFRQYMSAIQAHTDQLKHRKKELADALSKAQLQTPPHSDS